MPECAGHRTPTLSPIFQQPFGRGREKDIDEVLQVHTIFANVDKGILAKSEDLIEAFGTDNEDTICVEVLNKGEFQASEQERQMQVLE